MEYVDNFDHDEAFARYAESIPTERKLEIGKQLLQKTQGAVAMAGVIDYLSSTEIELLVTMMGERFPTLDSELGEALTAFFLSLGKSAERKTEGAWHGDLTELFEFPPHWRLLQ